jgi:hypothetical protein
VEPVPSGAHVEHSASERFPKSYVASEHGTGVGTEHQQTAAAERATQPEAVSEAQPKRGRSAAIAVSLVLAVVLVGIWQARRWPPKQIPPQSPQAQASLLITSDFPCDVTVDGKPQGPIAKDGASVVPVGLGDHLVLASANDGAKWEQTVSVRQLGQFAVKVSLENEVKKVEAQAAAAAEQQRQQALFNEKFGDHAFFGAVLDEGIPISDAFTGQPPPPEEAARFKQHASREWETAREHWQRALDESKDPGQIARVKSKLSSGGISCETVPSWDWVNGVFPPDYTDFCVATGEAGYSVKANGKIYRIPGFE